jgi:uncharacterized Zn finger protein
MSSSTPEGLLDRPLLRQLAGPEVFSEGETYFAAGRVRQVHAGVDRVTARVNGTRPYRVKLWRGRGELQFSCNCAAGREDAFCKHCVAVGLAWLAGPDGQPHGLKALSVPESSIAGPAHREETDPPRTLLREHLRSLEKDRLVSLVLEATDYDDILRRRLLLETIGVARPGGRRHAPAPASGAAPDLAAYRQILREAIECADYVDYDAMPDYAQSVEEAIRPMSELLRNGYAAAVVELAEGALVELDRASEMLDGGDGSLNGIYDDLQQLHLQACLAAKPDPEALADRLLAYELEGGLGVFNNAVHTYAEVLGKRGVDYWQHCLVRAWGELPAIEAARAAQQPPDAGRPPIDYRRFQILALMERLAESLGDLNLLAAVRHSDLTSVHDFLSLAELYDSAGEPKEAAGWAERGLQQFPDVSANGGLRDFLAQAYTKLGRHEEAAALAWEEFAAIGTTEYYEKLKEHAQRSGHVERWRKRAIAHVRARIAAERKAARAAKSASVPDYSPVVEILLADGLFEEAWNEANAHGCRPDLWLRLAVQREKTHPADTLRIYQERLGPTIAAGGHNAYREAVDLVSRIGALLERLGRSAEFVPYRAGIRAAHRQKRTFLKLLDASDR